MSRFSILTTKQVSNLALNSSFELWDSASVATAWVTAGSALVSSSSRAMFGAYGASVSGAGGYIRQTFLGLVGPHTFSVYLTSDTPGDNARIRVLENTSFAVLAQSPITTIDSGGVWKRTSITYTPPDATPYNVQIRLHVFLGTVMFDGFQAESGSYASRYFDGEMAGCYFLGTPHASTSVRTGGAGTDPVDLTAYGSGKVQQFIGAGVTPRDVTTVTDANGVPSVRGAIDGQRMLGIGMTLGATTASGLHSPRRQLADLLIPQTPGGPKYLRYQVPATPSDIYLELPIEYAGGLDAPALGQVGIEKLALRFVGREQYPTEPDPIGSAAIAGMDNTPPNNMLKLSDTGVWIGVPAGLPYAPHMIAVGAGGVIFAATRPTPAGGNPTTLWKLVSGLWSIVLTVDGSIDALAADPRGYIAVGGNFNNVTVPPAAAVARPYFTASFDNGVTWVSGAASGNGAVTALEWGDDNKLYVGGFFTTWGSIAGGANSVVTGSPTGAGSFTWARLDPSNPAFGYPPSVIKKVGQAVWVFGGFLNIGGNTALKYVARWDLLLGGWSPLGVVGGVVKQATIDGAGRVWVAGQLDVSPFGYFLKRWNGVAWDALTTDAQTNPQIRALFWDKWGDTVWVGGEFSSLQTAQGTIAAPALAGYRNGQFFAPDILFPAPGTYPIGSVISMAQFTKGMLFGYGDNGALPRATVTPYTVSRGNARTYPILTVLGPGRLLRIENQTTKKILTLDYTLVEGERLIFDLRPGNKTLVSSLYGDSTYKLGPETNLLDFHLVPGVNDLTLWIPGATAVTRMIVTAYPTYRGFDV